MAKQTFTHTTQLREQLRACSNVSKLASKKLSMNVFGAFVFLPGFLLEAQHSSAQATSTSPLTAVDNVDLLRYAGMK